MSVALEEIEYVSQEQAIPMRRVWAMPNKCTFDIPPIRALVRKHLHKSKVSIDPFARNKRWATWTNDLNPETAADTHLQAIDFLKGLRSSVKADLIIFDPPYSTNQILECYSGVGLKSEGLSFKDYAEIGHWSKEKDICAEMLEPAGIFLHFGWHSNGLGINRGCEIKEILIVAHGRCHNDTICTVERKIESKQTSLFNTEI